MDPLPIDAHLPRIVDALAVARAAIVTAAPAAGKTTRVPPAVADAGPVIVLQPRRVAARSLARRIADERGWTIGREIGWHVRFERQFGPQTRVLFATEGILTARLQQDPLLSDFRTVILDEFHERSIHADLGIALARQAWAARADLRLLVMSATIDASRVAAFLDGCPVIEVPGLLHPVDVRYEPGASPAAAVRAALAGSSGHVLCFLPGAAEISRAARDVEAALPASSEPIEVVELHGSLDARAQDRALEPSSRRRVILATNIAETSLTVPGVAAVVDVGLQKVARYDPDRAVDSLETERITQDAADQRAGRAGRLGPGLALRLWDRADRLRPHREPEIHRVDLSGTVLDSAGMGRRPARVRVVRGAVARSCRRRRHAARAARAREGRPAHRSRPPHPAPSDQPAIVGDPHGGRRLAPGRARLRLSRRRARGAGRRTAPDDDQRSAQRDRARARSATARRQDRGRAAVARRRAVEGGRRRRRAAAGTAGRLSRPRRSPPCRGLAAGAARVGPRRRDRTGKRRA